jgi:hypothetical protein
MKIFRFDVVLLPVFCVAGLLLAAPLRGADNKPGPARRFPEAVPARDLADALTPEKWRQVEDSVDRGLAWLASQQRDDGSFPTLSAAQPAVTSFCVLAFLSRGHQPGAGPYGKQLERAIDYVVSCQKEDGLLCLDAPGSSWQFEKASHTASYNHAIAGLMLGEAYGQVSGKRAREVRAALDKALQFTRKLQTRPKNPADAGGWGYFRPQGDLDGDLSITAWQVMFLRSAKNAEFNVPKRFADEAVEYVRQRWDPKTGMFLYNRYGGFSRGLMAAGVLSLSMAGLHQSDIAKAAGDWLVDHPFRRFGESYGEFDRVYYSMFYCSQAAAQLGGHYWKGIYPPLVDVALSAQTADGSYENEPNRGDVVFGQCYSTSLAVLSLTPAYQLLPVYQR